jgi:hypothetical protein
MALTARFPHASALGRLCGKVADMRIGEWIVGLLVLVAVASYGYIAALALLK